MEIKNIESFLDYYERLQERTRRVVVLIPSLAMLGIATPPLFGLASEEVLEKSIKVNNV